jgi:hypothetical protein
MGLDPDNPDTAPMVTASLTVKRSTGVPIPRTRTATATAMETAWSKLRLLASGTVGGRTRRDKDTFGFRH